MVYTIPCPLPQGGVHILGEATRGEMRPGVGSEAFNFLRLKEMLPCRKIFHGFAGAGICRLEN